MNSAYHMAIWGCSRGNLSAREYINNGYALSAITNVINTNDIKYLPMWQIRMDIPLERRMGDAEYTNATNTGRVYKRYSHATP